MDRAWLSLAGVPPCGLPSIPMVGVAPPWCCGPVALCACTASGVRTDVAPPLSPAPVRNWLKKRKGAATLYRHDSRHIHNHSYIHTYQPTRTTAQWSATALDAKTYCLTRKGGNLLLPSTGSSPGVAIKRWIQNNTWTKTINYWIHIYVLQGLICIYMVFKIIQHIHVTLHLCDMYKSIKDICSITNMLLKNQYVV